ncbi:SDR family oxidoreductase [Nocardia sp. 2YAB30]|uniref:SDR family oxidoreductase n=1 Tax=unclassified Nocardia TaxID=2637762 RepID=UPI003F951888
MFAEVGELVGGIDILVNNAASGTLAPNEELEQRHWDRAFDTNLKGSLWCAEHAARMMADRGGGAIVNLSSLGAGNVLDNYMSVGISKAAVEELTRYLAVQFAPAKVRVNTASCGPIDGEVVRLFPQADQMYESIVAATPLGRMATEADLADVVLLLASDLAGWITGQTIVADGGLTLRGPFAPPVQDTFSPGSVAQVSDGASGASSSIARTDGVVADSAAIGSSAASPGQRPHPRRQPPSPLPPVLARQAESAVLDWYSMPVPQQNPPPVERAPESEQPALADDDRVIAVVGMGMVVPGASSPEEFWRLRLDGTVMLTEPGERWDLESYYDPDPSEEDRTYSRISGFIADPGRFTTDPHEDYTTGHLRHLQQVSYRAHRLGRRRGLPDRSAARLPAQPDPPAA